MWENGKSRKLAQMISQALNGQLRGNWQEFIGEKDDWDNNAMKEQFIKMLQNLGTKTFGAKTYKQQCPEIIFNREFTGKCLILAFMPVNALSKK